MGFDFDHKQRQQLGYQLIDRINTYFSSLSDRPVQKPAQDRSFRDLTDSMPELGADPSAMLDDIIEQMVSDGFHVPSANYFGLMNPTPTYMAVLAEALVAALNPQLASLARSQLASKIERETIVWLAQRVGWIRLLSCGGTFTTGGNEANFSALALALQHRFPGVREEGLRTLPAALVVYVSSESHHSLDKSVGLLGLGRNGLRRIPTDPDARMNVAALRAQIEADIRSGFLPLAIVATAGTTNSGAIDPLPEIVEVCVEHDLWLHVDAAYGGALIFSDAHRALIAGIEMADSITIDPHKWLAMPFAAGVLLTQHGPLLAQTFGVSPSYMPVATVDVDHDVEPPPDNYRVSFQWSRRMNSLKLWLTLQVHGRTAYEDLIARQIDLAGHLESAVLRTDLFALAVPRVLPILNLSLIVPAGVDAPLADLHRAIVEELTRDGEQWISSTFVNGKSVLRMMIISYLTEERHIDMLVEKLSQAAKLVCEQRLPTSVSCAKASPRA